MVPSFSKLKTFANDICNVTIQEILFFTAFGAYSVARALENIAFNTSYAMIPNTIKDLLQILALLSLLICAAAAFVTYDRRIKLIICAIAVLFLISYIRARELQLLWMLLFCISAKDKSLQKMPYMAIVIAGSSIVLAMFLDFFHLVGQSAWFTNQGRYSVGFIHPNVFGKEICTIILSWLLIRAGRLKLPDYIGLSILALLILVVSKSRTAFLGAGIAIVLFSSLLHGRRGRLYKRAPIVFALITLFFAIGSICGALFYDPNNLVFASIDKLLTGRLSIPHELLTHIPYGLTTIFGFNLSESSLYVADQYISALQGAVPIDNTYIHLFVVFGPISCAVFLSMVMYILAHGEYNQTKYHGSGLALFICSFIALSEVYILDPSFNYYLIVCFSLELTYLNELYSKRKVLV